MGNMTNKQRATMLLRRYDVLRAELRIVERDLAKAVTVYGRETGYWGLSKDAFRIQLDNEERLGIEDAADRDAWEKAHA
jgi:type II secretory pathway component PulJ